MACVCGGLRKIHIFISFHFFYVFLFHAGCGRFVKRTNAHKFMSKSNKIFCTYSIRFEPSPGQNSNSFLFSPSSGSRSRSQGKLSPSACECVCSMFIILGVKS